MGKSCGWAGFEGEEEVGEDEGKVEELERVEAGWTGPRVRRERAKWGSEASRVMADGRGVSLVCWEEI